MKKKLVSLDSSSRLYKGSSSRGLSPSQQYITFFQLLLGLFLIVFVCRFLFSAGSNKSPLTFASFLDWLQTADFEVLPIMDLLKDNVLTITGDWGILSFLKDFLNTILSAVKLLVFLGGAVLNSISSISQFLQFLLGV